MCDAFLSAALARLADRFSLRVLPTFFVLAFWLSLFAMIRCPFCARGDWPSQALAVCDGSGPADGWATLPGGAGSGAVHVGAMGARRPTWMGFGTASDLR